MLLTYSIVDFHLFYDGAVDIQKLDLLTRSQCKVSDAQVTVRPVGLFFQKLPSFVTLRQTLNDSRSL